MKAYVLIHEKLRDPGRGVDVKLFPTWEAAKAEMCHRFGDVLKDAGIDDQDAAFNDQIWGSRTKRENIWNGVVHDIWRIEEHEMDVSAAVRVKGGMVQTIIANADIGVDVYDLDVSSYPDVGEEEEADRRESEFHELSQRPDWREIW